LLKIFPERKAIGDQACHDDTKACYIDSIGGQVPVVDFTKQRFTASIGADTILYHASPEEIGTFAHKPTFFTADPIQAYLHASADEKAKGTCYLYEFKVKQGGVPNLVYFIGGNYKTPWDGDLTMSSFVAATTKDHQELIGKVCTNDHPWFPNPNGWRAPWDQDEVLLCNPFSWLDLQQSFTYECKIWQFAMGIFLYPRGSTQKMKRGVGGPHKPVKGWRNTLITRLTKANLPTAITGTSTVNLLS